MNKQFVVEKIFLGLFALAFIYQVFIPPVVGLADNGDFARIIDKVGIIASQGKEYMKNINLEFQIKPTYNIKGYQSSEFIFVMTSIAFNSLLSKDGLFNLLVLAGVHIASLLIALGVLFLGISKVAPDKKWITYLCALFFFTDVGYVAYLNSLYSEPASIIFLALTIGLVFIILSKINRQELHIGWIIAYFISSFLFVIAKPQNAAMGVFLAIFGFRLTILARPKNISDKMRKLTAGGFAALLVSGSFLLFAFGIPSYYRSGDLWNSVFLEIVGRSAQPQQDLKELGLPAEMIQYKGKYAFAPGVNRAIYTDFQSSWLYFRIFKFYIVHPDRLTSLIQYTTLTSFQLQPENLGNFESSSQMGSYSKSKAFTLWDSLRNAVLPKSLWTLVAILFVNIGVVWLKIKKFDRTISARLISELHLAIALMAFFQYLTVVLAEGTFELIKHMFLFNILLDITFVFLVTYVGSGLARIFRQYKKWPLHKPSEPVSSEA